jgi:uncharacterized membrane protein
MNPLAFFAMVGFVLMLIVSTAAYTFSKCGWYTFALGNGAGMAAITGMCDKLNEE